jgi:hypothetical protein
MYVVLVTNATTQEQCVYHTETVEKSKSHTVFNSIYEDLASKDPDLMCFVAADNSYCELFKHTNQVETGYLWNSTVEKRQVLYLLSLVGVFKCKTPKITVDMSCQTDPSEYEPIVPIHYTGYATSCFLQPNPLFTDELKLKLKLPNYGLRSN